MKTVVAGQTSFTPVNTKDKGPTRTQFKSIQPKLRVKQLELEALKMARTVISWNVALAMHEKVPMIKNSCPRDFTVFPLIHEVLIDPLSEKSKVQVFRAHSEKIKLARGPGPQRDHPSPGWPGPSGRIRNDRATYEYEKIEVHGILIFLMWLTGEFTVVPTQTPIVLIPSPPFTNLMLFTVACSKYVEFTLIQNNHRTK
ncbi:hypothetical protein L211DRAFT_853478 [Terfezia boudieri ATCC MYA-4762]|uniref:Uncharacterized protein n=1 Tax=Terfezia boudieri ATCC MYA-4762 TaxID=1051890 RepID=A0A3N4LBN1_9PEZI|nr:hypothetical protein L211DRAFT_853478 [Terfezia boudieri ATCC MYA-4762]